MDLRTNINPFIVSIERWAKLMDKDMTQAFKEQCGLFMVDVLRITPPKGGKIKTDAQAERNMQKKIKTDLSNKLFHVYAPKGKRKVTTVYGHRLKRPIYVPTENKNIETSEAKSIHVSAVRAIHNAGKSKLQYRRFLDKPFVTKNTLNDVLSAAKKSIGKLASGFKPALNAIGQKKYPAYVARNNLSGGSVIFQNREYFYKFVATGGKVENSDAVERRYRFATEKRLKAINNQIKFMIKKKAKK